MLAVAYDVFVPRKPPSGFPSMLHSQLRQVSSRPTPTATQQSLAAWERFLRSDTNRPSQSMKRMKLLLAVLALISVGSVDADCSKAADWARAFYSEHYSFYADPSDRILQFTTPEFGALLKREWEYSKGEVGHLDYDPWLGGQDGEIGKPVRFSVETESPDTAIVSMSYPFVLDSKHAPERHTVHLVLRKREHECWQLQDFITPRGDSLSYVYSLPQP
jgi:hypothetical protein